MFHRIAFFTTLLTLCVVVLGAYVRLSHAGLGCPDWPGCYGQVTVPESSHALNKAEQAFPGQVVVQEKAWKEMIHRYVAGSLGLLILALNILAWRKRTADSPVKLTTFLLLLIIFQALLGMWTVTLLLKPVIVMGHLLGGLTTLALLAWLTLSTQNKPAQASETDRHQFKTWALLALLIVYLQIALGGWTSANYAALACPDFPTCQGQAWPETDFQEAFTLWTGLGVNYEGGRLDNVGRMTVHMTHRVGAIVALLVIGLMALRLILKSESLKWVGVTILLLLTGQLSLGIANIIYQLPLPIAVAHNGIAACLLVSIIWLNHRLRSVAAIKG